MSEESLRSHYESLTRAIGFTRAADAKAGPVLALQVALLGALATRSEEFYSLLASDPWDAGRMAFIGVATAYAILLIAVIWLTALVYRPINSRTDRSLIFFEDIAALEFEDFRSRSVNQGSEQIECQLLDQIHRVSGVASVKMWRVR